MPRIDTIQVVGGFRLDEELVLTAGTEAASIRDAFGGQIHSLNVPQAAPPEAPRIMVTTEHCVVNMGLSQYELIVTAPSHVASTPKGSIDFAHSIVQKSLPSLKHLTATYSWVGVIANVEYPARGAVVPAVRLCVPVFDRLLTIPRDSRELASLQLQFGFREQGCFQTFTVMGFEARRIRVAQTPGASRLRRIEAESGELTESGLTVVTDINNKPDENKSGFWSDFNSIMDQLVKIVPALPRITNLEGVLEDG